MPLNVIGTGPYPQFLHTQTSFATWSFFSGEIITTDSFEANILDFGRPLSEIFIVNAGNNMAAFQWPDHYITTVPPTAANTASGIVTALPGAQSNQLVFRRVNKRGMKLRSAVDGASTTVYVFGI